MVINFSETMKNTDEDENDDEAEISLQLFKSCVFLIKRSLWFYSI